MNFINLSFNFQTVPAMVRAIYPAALLLIGMAGPAAAGEASLAVYRGIRPDEFIRSWLVLGPIPASADRQPDEAAHGKAFATDFLQSAGGEAGVQPAAGRAATIAGKDYQRRLVASQTAGLEKKLVEVAGRGELEAVKELLARGVRANGKDKRGLTPWQAARIHGHREVVEFLRSHGAGARMPPKLERVVDATFKDIVQDGWSGAAVLVARDGKVLLEKGYGLANLEHRVPVTPETKFRIGSITKQFTATAILKLQEQGKLDVGNRLSRFIPDFPRGAEVTIHHLLTHTSGIHSYTSKPGFNETEFFWKEADARVTFVKDEKGKVTKGIHQQG